MSNLTISATASPAVGNLLYPGGTGDVVVTIANPNPFPVMRSEVSTSIGTAWTSPNSSATAQRTIAVITCT